MNAAQAMASLCGSTTNKENFYEPNVGLYDGFFRRLESESDTEQSPERPERPSGHGSRSGPPLTGSSSLYNLIRQNRRLRTNLSEILEQQSAQEKVLTTLQQIQKKQCDLEKKLTMERDVDLKRQQDSSSSSSPSSVKKKKRVTRDLTVSSYEHVS